MSSTTTTYLNAASTSFPVQALDQYGHLFLGDLSSVTVVSDTPANVAASLSSFADGEATLTLTQAGGEGTAKVTVTDGTVSSSIDVLSYTPVLTSFDIGAAQTPAPTASPAPVASTTTTTSTSAPVSSTTTTTAPAATTTPSA